MVIRNTTALGHARHARHGFTLMEILVVVAIIVILAGLGGYYILGAAEDARRSAAKLKAQVIGQAVTAYSLKHNGTFPPSLQLLVQRDPMNANAPYLKNVDAIMDPWGREYQYNPNTNGLEPDIFCVSPQGQTYGNQTLSTQP